MFTHKNANLHTCGPECVHLSPEILQQLKLKLFFQNPGDQITSPIKHKPQKKNYQNKLQIKKTLPSRSSPNYIVRTQK